MTDFTAFNEILEQLKVLEARVARLERDVLASAAALALRLSALEDA